MKVAWLFEKVPPASYTKGLHATFVKSKLFCDLKHFGLGKRVTRILWIAMQSMYNVPSVFIAILADDYIPSVLDIKKFLDLTYASEGSLEGRSFLQEALSRTQAAVQKDTATGMNPLGRNSNRNR